MNKELKQKLDVLEATFITAMAILRSIETGENVFESIDTILDKGAKNAD